jgi:hypothetical protein
VLINDVIAGAELEHIKGVNNIVPDCLSRQAYPDPGPPTDDEIELTENEIFFAPILIENDDKNDKEQNNTLNPEKVQNLIDLFVKNIDSDENEFVTAADWLVFKKSLRFIENYNERLVDKTDRPFIFQNENEENQNCQKFNSENLDADNAFDSTEIMQINLCDLVRDSNVFNIYYKESKTCDSLNDVINRENNQTLLNEPDNGFAELLAIEIEEPAADNEGQASPQTLQVEENNENTIEFNNQEKNEESMSLNEAGGVMLNATNDQILSSLQSKDPFLKDWTAFLKKWTSSGAPENCPEDAK